MEKTTYTITLSTLSKAPQNISKKCNMSKRVVKPSGQGIDLKELEKAVKALFPYLSFVKIIKSEIDSKRFREDITLIIESRKAPKSTPVIEGLKAAYQTWEINAD